MSAKKNSSDPKQTSTVEKNQEHISPTKLKGVKSGMGEIQ
jgi:hypothetical protein